MKDLNIEMLRDLLHYNPDTGVFIWSQSAWRNKGDVAGCKTGTGYLVIGVGGKRHYAHRLAWLYHYGVVPDKYIDHINGIKTDNRISNLRDVSDGINKQNLKTATARSRTGFLGVCTQHNRPAYSVRIKLKGKSYYFGTFSTPEKAHEVYLENKRLMHEGCTI